MKKLKIIRATTVPTSLNTFCKGLLRELAEEGYEVVAVSSPGQQLQEIAVRERCRVVAVPMGRHISPLRDLRSLGQMWAVFRKEKPHMVHSMTPKAGLICMMAAWLARVPVRVHTFTGLVFPTATGLTKRILMLTDWLTCACATHVIPEGEGVKNDLLGHGITRKPLQVLGHGNVRGIDLNYYQSQNHEKEKGCFRFVFVGRIVRDKGMNELIEAFSRLHRECPATKLLLVGSREERLDPVSPDTWAEVEANEAIDAVGSQDDVRPFYESANALVLPSYREGFPNVVIEAGAMGLPSIVTDINGSREIIIEGENGTIIPPRDADALYQAMRRFVERPDEMRHMAANARQLVASRFEQGYVRQCLKDFYAEALSRVPHKV